MAEHRRENKRLREGGKDAVNNAVAAKVQGVDGGSK